MFLYIHGFNSSSQAGKAQELKRWLETRNRAPEWIAPDLPDRPAQAITLLSELIESAKTPPKLIGSSLGGFYATHLVAKYNLKAVLVNPAVHPGLLLRVMVGVGQKNWHDESKPTYIFTQDHLDELTELDQLSPKYPQNMLVMLENGDGTLDWHDAAAYYRGSHQLVFQGGNHGFTRFPDVIDLIDRF